ncbi:MAG: aromatic ring-hydroxylating dioxygenase subunit alpha [Armatimonadetes bacterium]|nr:aromatic ring-hydroxylating dioxygenase subunit alpha [Armatimonadota bacterium]
MITELARAHTLPSRFYTSEEAAAREREQVFASSWQYVGPADRVAAPGQFLTAVVADEPVLVVRGEDGVLRAMSNVCRHRASFVACEAFGTARRLKCPYHGWTYGLDGRLKGTPEFDGVEDFDTASMRLPEIPVQVHGPFVFVRINGDEALCIPGFLEHLAPHAAGLRHARQVAYEVGCNWKVYVDNYLDGGYHVAHLHPGLHGVLDYPRYYCELHDGWNVQVSPLRAEERPRGKAVGDVRHGDTAYYYWLYPNFMINCYSGLMDTNRVVPIDVNRCVVLFDYYFPEGTQQEKVDRSIEVAGHIQDEDKDICEAVQRGLKSRWYDTGRYSVRRENGQHQFHQMLIQNSAR